MHIAIQLSPSLQNSIPIQTTPLVIHSETTGLPHCNTVSINSQIPGSANRGTAQCLSKNALWDKIIKIDHKNQKSQFFNYQFRYDFLLTRDYRNL